MVQMQENQIQVFRTEINNLANHVTSEIAKNSRSFEKFETAQNSPLLGPAPIPTTIFQQPPVSLEDPLKNSSATHNTQNLESTQNNSIDLEYKMAKQQQINLKMNQNEETTVDSAHSVSPVRSRP